MKKQLLIPASLLTKWLSWWPRRIQKTPQRTEKVSLLLQHSENREDKTAFETCFTFNAKRLDFRLERLLLQMSP